MFRHLTFDKETKSPLLILKPNITIALFFGLLSFLLGVQRWLRGYEHVLYLQRLGLIPRSHMVIRQLFVIPLPGNLASSSGLGRHQACTQGSVYHLCNWSTSRICHYLLGRIPMCSCTHFPERLTQ